MNASELSIDQELFLEWYEARQQEGALYSAWYVEPHGSGCTLFVSDSLTEQCFDGFSGGVGEIENFEDDGPGGCQFVVGYRSYKVEVVPLPEDKWGSTATFDGGIECAAGVEYLDYSDDSLREESDYVLVPWGALTGDLDDAPDVQDFLDWLESESPDRVSSVGEDVVCNGTCNSWGYRTTNLSVTELEALMRGWLADQAA